MWRRIGMKKEEKKSFSRICDFLLSMETCKAIIQTIEKMWRYEFELRKRRNFFAKLQTKVQKPVWKEENVIVTKLSPHKSNKNKQE